MMLVRRQFKAFCVIGLTGKEGKCSLNDRCRVQEQIPQCKHLELTSENAQLEKSLAADLGLPNCTES